MQQPITIAYHARTDKDGWREICRHPIDSPEWSKLDRSFIADLLMTGDMVLTCGWNMWQIVKSERA